MNSYSNCQHVPIRCWAYREQPFNQGRVVDLLHSRQWEILWGRAKGGRASLAKILFHFRGLSTPRKLFVLILLFKVHWLRFQCFVLPMMNAQTVWDLSSWCLHYITVRLTHNVSIYKNMVIAPRVTSLDLTSAMDKHSNSHATPRDVTFITFWGVLEVAIRIFLVCDFYDHDGPGSSKLPFWSTFYYHFCPTKRQIFKVGGSLTPIPFKRRLRLPRSFVSLQYYIRENIT